MGSPRWKRLCLLLLIGLTFSIILYGHYYTTLDSPAGPRTASRLLQQDMVRLAPAEIFRGARSHGLTRESIEKSSRGNPTKEPPKQENMIPTKKKSSLCPWSLKSKVKMDPTFGKQFDFDIPVLMWEQHFTPETWDRLKERNVPYGWRGLSYGVIASTVRLLNDSANSRLFAMTRPFYSCIRCAVVGNGGILNGSRQGKDIDAHEFVFRYKEADNPYLWEGTQDHLGIS